MKKLLILTVLCIAILSCKKDDEPTSISITKETVTSTTISISWNKLSGEYVLYDLEYAQSGNELEYEESFYNGEIEGNSFTYDLTGLTPNTEYTIKISAFDYSNEMEDLIGDGTIKIKTLTAAVEN
jgi:hypothetical protein